MRQDTISQFVLTMLLFLCACSCAPIRTFVVDPANAVRAARQDIISSNSLSPVSKQALRMIGKTEGIVLEHGVDQSDRDLFGTLATPDDVMYVESEVAIGRAQRLERKEPLEAIHLYLHAARRSLSGMLSPTCNAGAFDLRCDSFKTFYSRSIMGVFNFMQRQHWQTEILPAVIGSPPGFHLTIARDATVEDPQSYGTIVPSATIGLEGLSNRHYRFGAGLPLTACRPKREESDIEQYAPRVGVCIPLTAILSFSEDRNGQPVEVELKLFNAITSPQINLAGRSMPLMADFTAPLASLLERTGVGALDGLLAGLSGDEEMLKRTGFYTLEPYVSEKIPLVTVHGLFSNPLTWMGVHNDMMGDPVIREHFQIWHYMYPTNLPILENARTFRAKLDELHQYLASKEKGRQAPGMVIISHSMGGLLAKTAVVPNSEPLKELFFGDPKAIDSLPSDIRSELDGYITFTRRPYIDRVVFIAVPHRGSLIADNWIGAIGKWLISLPSAIVTRTQNTVAGLRNIIRPELRSDFDGSKVSSVRGLSPTNPTLIGLAKIPVDEHIPFHSIMGDRGKGDTPNSSDGVVLYSSSHLDGAQSELIVPSDHTAQGNPLAVLELKRILHLHLESRPRPAAP